MCGLRSRGLARQPHNDKCRERLREVFKEGAKVRNAEGMKQDFEKELEKKRKKDERKEEDEDKRSRIEGGASSSTDMSIDPVGPERLMTSPAGEGKMSVDEVSRLIEVWVDEVGDAGGGAGAGWNARARLLVASLRHQHVPPEPPPTPPRSRTTPYTAAPNGGCPNNSGQTYLLGLPTVHPFQ